MNFLNISIPIAVGIVISFLGWFIKRDIFEKLDDTNKNVKELAEKFNNFEKSCIEKYVIKTDLDSNLQAHEKIWIEINGMKERVAKMESDILNTRKRK